jgi:hypothetical protein
MKKLFCLLMVFSLGLLPVVGCGGEKEKDKAKDKAPAADKDKAPAADKDKAPAAEKPAA